MNAPTRLSIGAAALLAAGIIAYQQTVIRRLQATSTQDRVELANAQRREQVATRTATETAAELQQARATIARQSAVPVMAAVTTSTASSEMQAMPPNAVPGQIGGLVDATTGEVLEYRTPPLDPVLLDVLPSAEAFDEDFFGSQLGAANFESLTRATAGFLKPMPQLQEYFATHGVLAQTLVSLADKSNLLEKSEGAPAEITTTLSAQFVESVVMANLTAHAIAERPTERPDAQELSRQIESLTKVLIDRMPPQLLAELKQNVRQ